MNNRKYRVASLIASCLSLLASASFAQGLNSAYFTDGYLYRHQLNPALGNDSTTYIAIPVAGNINARMRGDFGVQDVMMDNPMYPSASTHKLTTFLNPYIPADQALAGFKKGDNRIISESNIGLLSFGWRGWGGYNTIDLNLRENAGLTLPYGLFEFAKNTGNKHYDIGDINVHAQAFVELALGHSRDINDKLRLGAKFKVLLGVAQADFQMKDVKADLQSDDKWTIQGDAQADISMKGFKFKSERKDYNASTGGLDRVNDADVDGSGIGGFGAAIDLGAAYKLTDDLTLSASLLDLGVISWSNDIFAENKSKRFEFSGFHDVDMHSNQQHGTIDEQGDKYSDQLTDFVNLQDRGDKGGRTQAIGATVNLGAEYVLPAYRKLSFGLLGTTCLRTNYSWAEARASANWRPLKWLDGAATFAVGSFGTSAGWVLNLHPKGCTIFVGCDKTLTSVSEEYVPLSSNFSLSMGVNIAF